MTTAKYLDECKKKLDITSDYRLAKMWEIDDGSMSRYRSGSLKPDPYLCFRIAETLEKSPSEVIAELESQNTKSEIKSLYFKRFFSTVGLWITLGVALPLCNPKYTYAEGLVNTPESRASIDLKPHYTKKELVFLISLLIT